MSNKVKENNTGDLINQLCGELKAKSPRSPYLCIILWLIGSVAYLSVIVFYLGFRPDIMERLTDGAFLFEIGITTSILITAALASYWLSFPDCIQREWVKIIPVTLFFSFSLWVVAHSIQEGMGFIATMHLGHCVQDGMFMECIPIIVLIILTMRGNTTQPYWSMTMNILSVSSLGWIGLRLTCPMDEMGHSFFNHLLPITIIGTGLGFFARKLFKW